MSHPPPSLLTRVYYDVKPFVPRSLRWAVRRRRAAGVRRRQHAAWPILPSAGRAPADWQGWPRGLDFALVLTHDVEGPRGLAQVRPLAELEMRLGFRSSFNFIPEGSYHVPEDLLDWLAENGFEVGVHDLHHDGKLYRTRAGFEAKARRINHWLERWNACGFRSGFMLRQLGWLHDLRIAYDSSTFDTDPFEPQPSGAHTIFPYWIQDVTGESGYVELPYTLPQDSTLFLLLGERDAGVWNRKLRWIAGHGGMALMNVHPDYMAFENEPLPETYPASLYEDFLRNVVNNYSGRFWQALPREVAAHVRRSPVVARATAASATGPAPKIWIDLENTPHIPFFLPIVEALRGRGHPVVVTARDGYQTCEVAALHGLENVRIGRHCGPHLPAKVGGLLVRAARLLAFALKEKPALALNLGSRSQNLAARAAGIPVAEIMDYEFTAESRLLAPRWCLAPEVVCEAARARRRGTRVIAYRGTKEDVYVSRLRPDPAVLESLGLADAAVIAVIRPPATEAHYHNPASERLFERLMERIVAAPDVMAVLLPRNERQRLRLARRHPGWFATGKVVVPERVVDGLNLIWHSDLVVGGGGTMNREAAALGVPVYSIFRGRIGALDRHLAAEGRLVLIESEADLDAKIPLVPSRCRRTAMPPPRPALSDILGHLGTILDEINFAGLAPACLVKTPPVPSR